MNTLLAEVDHRIAEVMLYALIILSVTILIGKLLSRWIKY